MPKHLLFKTDNFGDYFLENNDTSIEYLPNSNIINLIIGSNNSGKSRFLRNLLSTSELIYTDTQKIKQYQKILENYNADVRKTGFQGILSILPLNFSSITRYIDSNESTLGSNKFGFAGIYRLHFRETLTDMITNVKNIQRYYIPTLRTAHSLFEENKKIENDIYANTIKNNHSLDIHGLKIFTGLYLYKEILKSRNSDKKTRELFEKFEDFLGKSFFDGKKVDIVAKFDLDERTAGKSDSELILIHVEGDNDTYKLYELGDGIQAIIILMYQIFMAEPDSFIYIDEPELHLHPGMQRLFLEQLCYNEDLKKRNLTYFITTHSNHFLDLTIEKDNVSIYAFSPRKTENGQKQFVIKNVNAGDNDILKHLGVNNSSVFMANCSIWVEGISDRNYIKAFLKAYSDYLASEEPDDFKSIKEDIDYAFFEYAGSNIDHYFFGTLSTDEEDAVITDINALALHNRIFLLADSDCADVGSAKKERLEKLKDKSKDNFHAEIIEEIREIENLLTNDIWNAVLLQFCNKKMVTNNEEDILKKLSFALSKNDSQNFQKEYVGKFLSELNKKMGDIDGFKIINESIYKQKTKIGTFTLKRELSEAVLKKVYEGKLTWEHFLQNPLIVSLTEKIYQFILESKN